VKILAIQFRYLGDAVLMTPALRAIKNHFPDSSLHVLVAQEIAPVLEPIPWLNKVWRFPRKRGKAALSESWPVIRALRRERFDLSVDFSNSDRGALVTFACGARQRLGYSRSKGFFIRDLCFTKTLPRREGHETMRNLGLLSAWSVPMPANVEEELYAPAGNATSFGTEPGIVCHIASSRPKKEWPLESWVALNKIAAEQGCTLTFCSGTSAREKEVLDEFKRRAPDALTLPSMVNLEDFMAILKKSRLFVGGDIGPLHVAAGLGVPTIGLFGPTARGQWAPPGAKNTILQGAKCICDPGKGVCMSSASCMAAISPEIVLQAILQRRAALPTRSDPDLR
jgi:heptosyltransferase-3